MTTEVERGIIYKDDQRSAANLAAVRSFLPASFAQKQWEAQTDRYNQYWNWFGGEALGEIKRNDINGDVLYQFPLRINSIRTFARKHTSVLFGEVPDSPTPLVKPIIRPKQPLDGSEFREEDEKLAKLCENIISEVWMSSNGRAIQWEAGEIAQFLGGCVFQVCYQPWRDDLLVPVTIKTIRPDFFLPVWSNEDYFTLHEAFVLYNIPRYVAVNQYGISKDGPEDALYMEHWTRTEYTISIDGIPIAMKVGDVSYSFNKAPNPFEFVPFVYIPHLLEGGSRYGTSIIEDLTGLIEEYNARMSDTGVAVLNSVERVRFVANTNNPKAKEFQGTNLKAIDLGVTPPTSKNAPEAWVEDPPRMDEALVNFSREVWRQALREAHLGDIAFGEDEGSQRSALTLAFRMWPITSHTRTERTFWTDGLNMIGWMILKILSVKTLSGYAIPPDFKKRLHVAQDWAPQIPRDREQQINEIILRSQAGLMSPEFALESFGDVRNVPEELERIKDFIEWRTKLSAEANQPEEKPGTTPGSGAITNIEEPIADSGLSENA